MKTVFRTYTGASQLLSYIVFHVVKEHMSVGLVNRFNVRFRLRTDADTYKEFCEEAFSLVYARYTSEPVEFEFDI